jgi:hypothetical protein
MFYRGKNGNYVKVESFTASGEDQVLVDSGNDFQFFTSESYFKNNVVKSLPENPERQAALEEFIESLPE